MKNVLVVLGLSASLCLVGCGGSEESETAVADEPAAAPAAEPETASEETGTSEFAAVIEARQQNYKTIGGNFKTISDNLRADEADIEAVQAAAAKVAELSLEVPSWFPEGSGPEAGVETEALPAIWEKPAEFTAAVERFQTTAAALNEAAETSDMAAVGAAFRPVGGSCGGCHDEFRLDDD
ncbi:MAG: cytochrome C [Ponticaulis sp.]|nr:cytochrome C [Ponticaulis sp.]